MKTICAMLRNAPRFFARLLIERTISKHLWKNAVGERKRPNIMFLLLTCKKKIWCYVGDIDQHVKEWHKLVGEHCIIQHCNIFLCFQQMFDYRIWSQILRILNHLTVWNPNSRFNCWATGFRILARTMTPTHIFTHKKKIGTSSISCDKNVKRHKVDIFGFQILSVETACKNIFA